ncbi:MAG: CinA family protein [Alphaproteobacteria bacterium]
MTVFSKDILTAVQALLTLCQKNNIKIITAESCTGGLLSGALTSISGASAVFEHGFVTYSNASKIDLLGVKPHLLKQHGAVSHSVAKAMAEGAFLRASQGAAPLSHSLALSITGIADKNGAETRKPVGLVYIGLAGLEQKTATVKRRVFSGNRAEIRQKTIRTALEMLAHAVANYADKAS